MIRYLFLFIVPFFTSAFSQSLIISEVMSSNQSFLFDQDGDDSDWIEVYNNSNTTLNLENYYLSDDDDEFQKWKFPTIHLAPFSYLVVFASDKNRVNPNQELHTNFSIKAIGEKLFLSYNDSVIHSTPSLSLNPNQSIAIQTTNNLFLITDEPTPKKDNSLKTKAELIFSKEGGLYKNSFFLSLTTQANNTIIRYTLDGNIPTSKSTSYTTPLYLDQSFFSTANISQLQLSPPDIHFSPTSDIPKAIIIRAAIFDNEGNKLSDVYTNCYFIEDLSTHHTLPILSLVVATEDLFNDTTGIMIPGIHWDKEDPDWTGNYYQRGDEWEKPVHATFYEPDGTIGFSQNAGLRTHGGNSRRFHQKGLKLYARDDYGNDEFKYKMYPDRDITSFKRFVLGPSSASWSSAGIEDFICNKSVTSLNIDRVATRPIVVYINGEYWGIYYLEEKIDKHYIASYYDVNKDSIDLLNGWGGGVEEGSNESFLDFYDFIANTDFSISENFQLLTTKIDIDNFIDYQLFEIYSSNIDWPANNTKIWRSKSNNGKWRWIFFDGDAGLQRIHHNSLLYVMDESDATEENNKKATLLFRKLIKNDTFKMLFFTRAETLFNSSLSFDTLFQFYKTVTSHFYSEINNQMARINYPKTTTEWAKGINRVKNYITYRPCVLRQHILDEFQFLIDIPECTDPLEKINNLETYPNPSAGEFILTFESLENSLITFSVIDVFGRIKFQANSLAISGENQLKINIEHLDSGIYLYHLQTGGSISSIKGIISKK